MIKKKTYKLKDEFTKFTPTDVHGNPQLVACCKNKSSYMCIFPGEPIAFVCKSHIKDESYMRGIEKVYHLKSKKEIPIEDMGFEKESPTIQETVEKTKRENSNMYPTEFLCVRGIRAANGLINLYQSFMDSDENKFGKDSTSYKIWELSKKLQEDHLSVLCKILINTQVKPKRIKKAISQ